MVALSTLILLLTVLLNVGFSSHVPDPLDVDLTQLDFLVLNESASEPDYLDKQGQNSYPDKNDIEITDFDPNKIDAEQWMSFGFSEKQAASIINYRNNYGPFKKKEDIHKLYVVSDEKFAQLEPHIIIQKQEKNQSRTTSHVEENSYVTPEVIELNNASKEQLMALNGIGEYYADRILSYRSKIGGFVDPEQILGMSIREEAKAAILELTVIDAQEVSKTNINTASKDQLRNIPYSNWLTVATILKFRDTQIISDLEFLTETEITAQNKAKFQFYIEF